MNTFTPATITPIHEHDCECCKFCGNYVSKGELFDLYFCPTEQSLIARYGVDGDYMSMDVTLVDRYPTDHPLGFLRDVLKARKVIKNK